MQETRRREYLEAIGIDLWLSRAAAPAAAAAPAMPPAVAQGADERWESLRQQVLN